MSTSSDHTIKKFVFGGMSCMTAACVTNPIDVIKTRLQIQQNQGELAKKGHDVKYKGFVRGVVHIVSEEGIAGLYKGITASLLREGSYSTIRMGMYDVVKDALGCTDPKSTPLWKKVLAGGTAGALGAAIANPTDLVKVRMQASTQHHYRNTFVAFYEIAKNEGFVGLYKGVGPTTYRAALLTASQLPSYDHTKHFLLNHGILKHDNTFTHFVSSMIAGFIAALVTSPVDVVKTRIMNQKFDANGKGVLYQGTLDCVAKTIRAEGPLGLYKGFFPNWMRIGPHTIVTFIVYEQLRRLAGIQGI